MLIGVLLILRICLIVTDQNGTIRFISGLLLVNHARDVVM